MRLPASKRIEMTPIGFVKRLSSGEDERDRNLLSQIVIDSEFAKGLEGIEEWSHIYILFWMNRIPDQEKTLVHPEGNVGIFATRAPIHPNPIGLTLVKLVKHEGNVIWVRGLDALDNTPVLDIKPYPDWEKGQCIVITDFKIPSWLRKLKQDPTQATNATDD